MQDWLATFLREVRRSWAYRWFAFNIAVGVTLLGAAAALVLPDIYTSRAQVYVNTETLLKPLLKGIAVELDAGQQVTVFQRTLLNTPNLVRVLRELDFDLEARSPAAIEGAVADLRSRLGVEGVGKELFSITFDDIDPTRAQTVVKALLAIFIDSNLGQSRVDMEEARTFVEGQIENYARELRQKESEIAEFRVRNADFLGQGSFASRLEAARKAQAEAQALYDEARLTRDQIKEQLERTDPFGPASELPPRIVLSDNTIITAIDRINTLRSQLEALRIRYTDQHPDVIATRRELESLLNQYATTGEEAATGGRLPVGGPLEDQPAGPDGGDPRAPNPAYEELKVRLLESETTILATERLKVRADRNVEQLESLSGSAPAVEAELSDLTRDYDVLKRNYEELLKRREAARLSQAVDVTTDSVEFRVIEPPTLPAAPSGPARSLYIFLGVFAGVVGGAGAAYLRASARNALVGAKEVQDVLALPVLGLVSRNEGVLGRVGRSADLVALATGFAGLIIGALLLATIAPAFEPVRRAIYVFIDSLF